MKFDIKDLVITAFTGGPRADVTMRILHKPSGAWVENVGRSQIKLKESLMEEIRRIVEPPQK